MPESPLSPTAARQTSAASSLLSHTDTGAAERRDNGDSCSGVSVENWQSLHHKQAFLAMMAPQQMQQLLSPNQLQVLIQQKQQALLLQQQHLKEFYKTQQHAHLQLLQQQPSKKVKSELPAQHLVFQQLLQLQQQQQQLLQVQRPILTSPALSPVGFSPADVQLIWKELTNALTENKPTIKSDDHNSFANCVISTKVQLPPQSPSSSPRRPECADLAASHVLYSHGVCTWPGCESVCKNLNLFIKHIDSEHTLDDRSTAQCRVQMQVVEQLELQLCKERQRLRAMMSHLHLPSLETRSPSITSQHSPQSDKAADPRGLQLSSVSVGSSLTSVNPSDSAQVAAQRLAPVNTSPRGCEEESHADCVGAVRRRRQPLVYSLSSENEYELYKNTDIRPPFTYATLIRQAIMEASDMQLTLNEIYNWFTRTFAYFRRNAATWKNAVRHNLSLHKCFVRVENVKGAVWTVDEVEYQRRRSQKITGSPLVIQNMSSNMTFGTGLNCGSQTTLMEASLPGLKKENKATNGNSHCDQNASLQVQRSVFLKDEMMHLNDQEPLMLTGTRVDLRHDRSENDEAHVFDLE